MEKALSVLEAEALMKEAFDELDSKTSALLDQIAILRLKEKLRKNYGTS